MVAMLDQGKQHLPELLHQIILNAHLSDLI